MSQSHSNTIKAAQELKMARISMDPNPMAFHFSSTSESNLDLYGDVLEAVLMRVPTIDLIPASRVSREWHRAVRSSLRRSPRRFPWLILRNLRHPSYPIFSLDAFDPFSSSWLSIPDKRPEGLMAPSFLRGSSGDRMHTLSATKMAVSEDPFGTTWRKETKAPKMWRQDAVVAEVGQWLVVAGGGCPMALDDEEEIGVVEVYDKHTATWESAELFPAGFDGSTSATWLSVAASDERLYVMEKQTGFLGCFDPKSRRWGPTCQIRPETAVSAWGVAIGRNKRLLLVGVGPACQSKMNVRFWEVDGETMRVLDGKLEEMPTEMVDRLFPIEDEDYATWQGCSVEVCGTERGGYVYNSSQMRNGAVLYELAEEKGGKVGRWEWVPLTGRVGDNVMGRIEFGCSAVGLDELEKLKFRTNGKK